VGNARIYPASITQWPGHERWFDQRISPLSCEFTIHQNTAIAAFVYGFLTEGTTTDIIDGVITEVEKKSEDESLTAFPNPTNDFITIKSTELNFIRVAIFTYENRKVEDISFSTTKDEYGVDTKGLSSGLYIFKIFSAEGKTKLGKFLIRR
jgi:hypothetical protein